MSQTTTAVNGHATVPPSADFGISNRIQDLLSNEIVQRIVGAVAVPLSHLASTVAAVPLSILAIFTFQPYLLLDPTTTLIGIGLAVAVNTLALHYFTPLIQKFWSDYWATHHRIPEVAQGPSIAIETTQAPTPTATAQDPIAEATEAYQSAVRALEAAIIRLKKAKTRKELVGQGKEELVQRLRADMLTEKGRLLECANIKRGHMQDLVAIDHQEILRNHGLTVDHLIQALPEQLFPADSEEAAPEAIGLIKIDLTGISKHMDSVFRDTLLQLDHTVGRSYTSGSRDTVSQEVLELDQHLHVMATGELQTKKREYIRIETTETKEAAAKEQKQMQLNAIEPPLGMPLSAEKKSALQLAQEALITAEGALEEKTKAGQKISESIKHFELYGVPEEDMPTAAIKENPYQFESETALKKLQQETEATIHDPAKEDVQIATVVATLNEELVLLRSEIEKKTIRLYGTLLAWKERFDQLSESSAKRLKELDENIFSEFFAATIGRVINKQAKLTELEKQKCTAYYTALGDASKALSRFISDVLSTYQLTNSKVDPSKYVSPFPEPPPLMLAKNMEDIAPSMHASQFTAQSTINQLSANLGALATVHQMLDEKEMRRNIEKIDLAFMISEQAELLADIRFSAYTQKIRVARQEIEAIKAKKPTAEKHLPMIVVALKKRQEQIRAKKETLEKLEKDVIILAKQKRAQARDQLVLVEVGKATLIEEIERSAQVLRTLGKEKTTAKLAVDAQEAEITRLNRRIELAQKARKLEPIMIPIRKIKDIDADAQSLFKTIVSTYYKAKAAYELEESKQPQDIQSADDELIAARIAKKALAIEEQKAFQALTQEHAKHFDQEIQTLRGARYRVIVERSQSIQTFYENKAQAINGTLLSTSAASIDQDRNRIRSSRLEILERKIAIAAATIKMHAYSFARGSKETSEIHLKIDEARLRLAEHRLKRNRLEEEWRVSHKGTAAVHDKVLPLLQDMIKEELRLVFHYLSLKLARDASGESKHAAKANFAILKLILDRIAIEASVDTKPHQFNIGQKIKDYLKEVMRSPEALKFNELAYGNLQKPKVGDSPSKLVKLVSWLSRSEDDEGESEAKKPAIPNPIVDKLIADLDLDLEKAAELEEEAPALPSSLKLTNFLVTINNKSSHLHKVKERVVAVETPTVSMIESKLTLIQLSLTKPLSANDQFVGKYKEKFLPVKQDYQKNKYTAKSRYAAALQVHTEEKAPYIAAKNLKAEEIRRIQEADRVARQRAADAIQAEQLRLRTLDTRNQAVESRSQAMQSNRWLEKLSYLVPTAALWALYQFSPLLNYISLSLRVSQNILFISSVTHLFVQSFFRSEPPTETSRPLSPERVTAA